MSKVNEVDKAEIIRLEKVLWKRKAKVTEAEEKLAAAKARAKGRDGAE